MRVALVPLIACCWACGEPISNQALYEDELFLAALPTADRMAPPADIRLARVGDSLLLAAAVGQAAAIEQVGLVIGASGDVLRETTADERGARSRSWKKVRTSAQLDGNTHRWWVRGQIDRPAGVDAVTWTIEASADDGTLDWIEVGIGEHRPDGSGSFTWQLATHGELFGVDASPPVLDFEYADQTEKRPRELFAEEPPSVGIDLQWSVIGDGFMGWIGPLQVTDASPTLTGGVQVLHGPDVGGRATGTLIDINATEIPFDVCWNDEGDDTWVSYDGQPQSGSSKTCQVSI